LFTAYVASLRAAGKRSAKIVERSLVAAAESIGSSRPAAEVGPGDVVPHLAAIHDRGAAVHAAMVRAYLRAAFAYGLKSEHSYTQEAGARWGLTSNPIAAIPVAEGISNPRDRFFSPAEVRTFWRWLETFDIDSKFTQQRRSRNVFQNARAFHDPTSSRRRVIGMTCRTGPRSTPPAGSCRVTTAGMRLRSSAAQDIKPRRAVQAANRSSKKGPERDLD
jgi:hypothetical protein